MHHDPLVTLEVNRVTLQRVVDLIHSLPYEVLQDRLKATGSHGQGHFAITAFLDAAGDSGVFPQPPRWELSRSKL